MTKSSLVTWFRPHPHVLDLRSLVLFRTLFGLYLVYDVVSRILPFPISVEWYTAGTPDSFLHSTDSPHGNVLHKLWFARTSASIQYSLFASTLLLSLALAIGKLTSPLARLLLWMLVVSMQHRCMHVHDGSDNYTRQLLMWYSLLPEPVHTTSLPSLIQKHKKDHRQQHTSSLFEITSLACFGLTLQMTLMYLGTVAKRVLDGRLSTEWIPPELSAVHFVLRDAFAIRNNFVVNWMRSQPFEMTQGMTAHAMLAESSSVLWFLCPNLPIRLWGFIVLSTLHFGLLLVTRLPNWQFVAMIASTLWIPSSVWNGNDDSSSKGTKAFDADSNRDSLEASSKSQATNNNAPQKPSRLRQFIMIFLLSHMVYNFSAERRWIPKWDGGDIGEFFRISQFWVMYSTAPRSSVTTTVVGYRNKKVTSIDTIASEEEEDWVDVFEAIETSDWTRWVSNGAPVYSENPAIVSPRWERALNQWSRARDRRRIKVFLGSLCEHNPALERLEYVIFHYKVVPPSGANKNGSARRWEAHSDTPDEIIPLQCNR